jgi:hypothetical protein
MIIAQVIRQIQSDDWYNISEEVEIAKGKNKIRTNLRGFKKQLMRVLKGNKIYK